MNRENHNRQSAFCAMVIAASVAFCAGQANASVTQVGDGYVNPVNGHTYYLILPESGDGTLSAMESYAVNTLGGHLATINDALENDFVFNTFAPIANGQGDAFLTIGLYKIDEQNFAWLSGESFSMLDGFSAIGAGEPNGAMQEPFFAISDTTDRLPYLVGQWVDIPDSSSVIDVPIYGVVEVSTSVPSPASAALIGIASVVGVRRRR